MQPRRLVDLGLPTDPVAWFTVLGLLTVLVGAAAFRVVEPHVDTVGAAVRGYAVACAAGAVGLVVLAGAPEEVSASAAVLLVAGITVPLTRTLGTIVVNQQAFGEVRATVHSFLAQAEYLGVIACGLFVAAVARLAGLTPALLTCAALFAITVLVVGVPRRRTRRRAARTPAAGLRCHPYAPRRARARSPWALARRRRTSG
jgi:MFS transporter, DHA3 family, tetracycline resistance protein